jgi:hypothetical protein
MSGIIYCGSKCADQQIQSNKYPGIDENELPRLG